MQGYRHSCNKLQNEKGKLGDKSQKRNVEQGADVAVERIVARDREWWREKESLWKTV